MPGYKLAGMVHVFWEMLLLAQVMGNQTANMVAGSEAESGMVHAVRIEHLEPWCAGDGQPDGHHGGGQRRPL